MQGRATLCSLEGQTILNYQFLLITTEPSSPRVVNKLNVRNLQYGKCANICHFIGVGHTKQVGLIININIFDTRMLISESKKNADSVT